MKMKRNEFFKHISGDKMPDLKQVRLNCINQTAAKQKKPRLKTALIIATALTAVFTLSAFAGIIPSPLYLGEILENLSFKGFNANKIEEFDPSRFTFTDDTSVSDMFSIWNYEITDPKAKAAQNFIWADRETPPLKVYFKTLEEAGETLAFTPKGLSYIPDGYLFYNVSTFKDEMDNYDNNCYINYISNERVEEYVMNEAAGADIMLSATYVGENATIQIDTKMDIEKIILNGGIESLLMVREDLEYLSIHWIKDGVGYLLSGSPHLGREELIKMAESVD